MHNGVSAIQRVRQSMREMVLQDPLPQHGIQKEYVMTIIVLKDC